MEDLISRSALIEEFEEYEDYVRENGDCFASASETSDVIDYMKELAMRMPTVEAEPVVHGDAITRIKIYNYIKSEINPYGKPFKGTLFEFGEKIMDYVANMGEQGEWIKKKNIDDTDWYVCSRCNLMVAKRKEICPVCGAKMDGGVKNEYSDYKPVGNLFD